MGQWIVALGLCCFDQAGDDGAGLTTALIPGEQPVFAADGDHSQCAFCCVVVDCDGAVVD